MSDDAQVRKELIADLYSRAAASYGRVGPNLFAPFGRWLVERMNLSPGERVLDVATGRGAVLFEAAEKVGTDGLVVGIDLSEEMVRETEADVQRKGMVNVKVQRMDAEELDFPDASFDAVLCSYALWFFPHIERAVGEFYRVLRPGGKVGICVPSGGDERWVWYPQLVFAYHAKYHFLAAPEWGGSLFPYAILEPSEVDRLLSEVGFGERSSAFRDYEFVYATEQEWWDAQWTEAARLPLERMEPGALETFKAEAFQHMASLKEADVWHYRRKACCVVGRKPGAERSLSEDDGK